MGLWIMCYFFNLSQGLQKCDLKIDSVLQVFETLQFSSVAQLCPTPLQPHEPQYARPPCPSPTPGAYPNSCALSR